MEDEVKVDESTVTGTPMPEPVEATGTETPGVEISPEEPTVVQFFKTKYVRFAVVDSKQNPSKLAT